MTHKDKVVEAYQNGETLKEIIERLEVDPYLVRSYLMEEEIELKYQKNGKRRTKTPVNEMVADYEQGLSIRCVAKKHGFSKTHVFRTLKKAGVQTRGTADANIINLPHEDISQEYKRGSTLHELAKKHSCSTSTITRSLNKSDTPRRPRGPLPR